MTLDEFLNANGLPKSVNVRPDDRSGWMTPFAIQGQQMCASAGAIFAFLESGEMQAVAVQDTDGNDVVGVFAGMFWMLCRLAAVAAGSGVFPGMKGLEEPAWNPDLLRSLQTPRELLEEARPFDWELESIGWNDAPERQMLFFLVLTVLFRFVVFHELGHVRNDHIRRRINGHPAPAMADRLGPELIDPAAAIPSQAREIIADGSALLMTIESLENELTLKHDLELTQILRERLVPDKVALIGFVLTILHLYFRMADRSDWEHLPVDRLSHPPAPFRMKALFSVLIEKPPLGLSEDDAIEAVKRTILIGDAVISVMLDVFPKSNWMQTIETPDHDRHFRLLFEEFPRWVGRIQTASG